LLELIARLCFVECAMGATPGAFSSAEESTRGEFSLGDPAGETEVPRRALLVERSGLPSDSFDGRHDYAYASQCTQGRRFGSGSPLTEYFPPCGFDSLGLSVGGYEDQSFMNRADGWHVAYHGTDLENIPAILEEGLKPQGGRSRPRHGDLHGHAIYMSPYPEVARAFAGKVRVGKQLPDLILQCRVRPGSYTLKNEGRTWLVNDTSDVRCHSLLFLREFVLFDRPFGYAGARAGEGPPG